MCRTAREPTKVTVDESPRPGCSLERVVGGVMSLNSNVSKELALHPAQRLWVPALELSKRLQKAKRARASEWTKNHRHRVEPSPPGKVVKRHPIQREPPASALRPIDNHGALAEVRQDVLLDIVVPNWTVGIHKQDVPPTDAPPRPNDDVQANGGDDEKHQPEHCNDHEERKKGNDQGVLPPSCFRFGLWSAHDVRVGLTSLSEAQPVERKPPRSEHAAMELKSHGKILTLRAVGSTGLVSCQRTSSVEGSHEMPHTEQNRSWQEQTTQELLEDARPSSGHRASE